MVALILGFTFIVIIAGALAIIFMNPTPRLPDPPRQAFKPDDPRYAELERIMRQRRIQNPYDGDG